MKYQKQINWLVVCIVFISSLMSIPQPALAIRIPSDRDINGLYRVDINVTDAYSMKLLNDMGIAVLEPKIGVRYAVVDVIQMQMLVNKGFYVQRLVSLNQSSIPIITNSTVVDLNNQQNNIREAIEKNSAIQSLESSLIKTNQLEIKSLTMIDSDDDGISDDEEVFWCTDRLKNDTDGDGISDNQEINSVRTWMSDFTTQPPANGFPFDPNKLNTGNCVDSDFDGVPDLAEVLLGLNPKKESTDNDRFDDGQELFGLTVCAPINNKCSYGAYPNENSTSQLSVLPTWLKAPSRHPFIAATPNIALEIQSVAIQQGGVIIDNKVSIHDNRTVEIDTNLMQRLYDQRKNLQDVNAWAIDDINNPFKKMYGQVIDFGVVDTIVSSDTKMLISYRYRNVGGDIATGVDSVALNAATGFQNKTLPVQATTVAINDILPNQTSASFTATVSLDIASLATTLKQDCDMTQNKCRKGVYLSLNNQNNINNNQMQQQNVWFDFAYEESGYNAPIGQFSIPTWGNMQKNETIPDILARVFTVTRNKFGDPADVIIPIKENQRPEFCGKGDFRDGWWFCKYSLLGATQITHSPTLKELYQFQSYTAAPSAYVYFMFQNNELHQKQQIQQQDNNAVAAMAMPITKLNAKVDNITVSSTTPTGVGTFGDTGYIELCTYNCSFENGNMSGWTQEGGSFDVASVFVRSGSYSVNGTSATNANFYRIFSLDTYANYIDQGYGTLRASAFVDPGKSEHGAVNVYFLNASQNIVGSGWESGWQYSPGTNWLEVANEISIPATARYVKVAIYATRSGGSYTDVNVDDVTVRAHFIYPDITNTPSRTFTATKTPTKTITETYSKTATRTLSITPEQAKYCQVYDGENLPLTTRDLDTVNSYAIVNEQFNITSIRITNVNIVHPYVGELTISLINPLGQSVELFDRYGGSGDNLTNTAFDDSAGSAVSTGSAPFSGTYKPAQSLNAYANTQVQGVWQLAVNDASNGDTGTVLSWRMEVCGSTLIQPSPMPNIVCKAFKSTDIPKDITYNSSNTSVKSGVYVSDDFMLRTVRIANLSIDHGYIGDVVGKLTDPRGGTIVLFSRVGGTGKKFNAVGFRDDATLPISAGSAPFSGNYRPTDPLGRLAWGRSSGTWLLDLQDVYISDNGKLLSWTLELCGFYHTTSTPSRTSLPTSTRTFTPSKTPTPTNTATHTNTRTSTGTKTATADSEGKTATQIAILTENAQRTTVAIETATFAPFATSTAQYIASATKAFQQSATAQVRATDNAVATFWRNVERTQGSLITATIRKQLTTTAQLHQTQYAYASRTALAVNATNNALQQTANVYRTQTVIMQKTAYAAEIIRTQSALNNNGSAPGCVIVGGCKIFAWGNNWQDEMLDKLTNIQSVSTGAYHTIIVDGQGVPKYRTRCPLVGPGDGYCAMLNDRMFVNPPPSWFLGKIRFMKFSYAFLFQRENGSIGVWPQIYDTPWILGETGDVTSIESTDDNYGGHNVNFVLRRNGTVFAWGGDTFVTPEIVYYDEPIVNVDAECATVGFLTTSGKLYTRSIKYQFEPVCKYAGVPPAYNDYIAFSIGRTYGVAVRANGDMVPFGYGVNWDASYGYTEAMLYPPAGIVPVKGVAAGIHHACAMRVNGAVACWGKNTHNQMNVPSGSVTGVIAGMLHTIAISGSGTSIIPPPPPIVGELRAIQLTNANQQPLPNISVQVFNNMNVSPTIQTTDQNGYVNVNYIPGNIRVQIASDVWQIADTQTINFDVSVIPQIIANRIPVIFVPGIMGSFLDYSGCNIWVGMSRLGRCELLPSKSKLLTDDTNIIATDAIRDVEIRVPFLNFNLLYGLAYDTLINQLTGDTVAPMMPLREWKQNLGFFDDAKTSLGRCEDANRYVLADPSVRRKETTFYVLGYDWRKSTSQSAVSLNQLIRCVRNTHGGGRVNLVGHSMGGLVIKQYILSRQTNPNYVNRISTFNTPYLGAMRALEIFITGNYDPTILTMMLEGNELATIISALAGIGLITNNVVLVHKIAELTPYLYFELKNRIRTLARASVGAIELMPTDIYLKQFDSNVIRVNSVLSNDSFSYSYDKRVSFWQKLDDYVSGTLKVSTNRLKDQTATDIGMDNSNTKAEAYTKNIDYLIQFSSNPNTTIVTAERNWLTLWSFNQGAGDGTVPEFSLSRQRDGVNYNPQSTTNGSRFVAINAYCGVSVSDKPLDHTSLTKYQPALDELAKFLSQEQYTGIGNSNCINGANATLQNIAAPMQIAPKHQVVLDNMAIVENTTDLSDVDITLPMPSRYVFDSTTAIPMRLRVKTTAVRSGVWSLVSVGDNILQRDVWIDTLPIGSELIVEVVNDSLKVIPANSSTHYAVFHDENLNGVDFVPPVPVYTVTRYNNGWRVASKVNNLDTLWYSYDGLNYQKITAEVVLDKSTSGIWLYAEDQFYNRSEPIFIRP